ncbi:unnamed protein product, partial [Polarella glacialis]
ALPPQSKRQRTKRRGLRPSILSMAITADGRSVPDILVGPTATTAAAAVLVLSLLMSLALALAQMKTEKLSKEVKATLAPRTPAQRSSEAVGDAEEPQRRRRPKRVRRSPLQRMVLQFFIADEGSEDESSQGDEGPYQLDDGCWISLPEDACARTRPAEHFIGDKNISQAESNRGIPAPPEYDEDDEPVG